MQAAASSHGIVNRKLSMYRPIVMGRRDFSTLLLFLAILPTNSTANAYVDVSWEDLIPDDVSYPEIVGEGTVDFENDHWAPVFDGNAGKTNTLLDGASVRIPGYVIPIGIGADGVNSFILVPYLGACIHVPPPPPNQLVFVKTEEPWIDTSLWSAVWVSGRLDAATVHNELAEVGYTMVADIIERHTDGPRNQRFSRTPFHPFNWF